jgi:hypothetical protein
MARSSQHQQREAERRYPVRVRIAVPPEGLGQQLVLMHAWLDDTCGAESWAAAPAGSVGVVNDAIAFYSPMRLSLTPLSPGSVAVIASRRSPAPSLCAAAGRPAVAPPPTRPRERLPPQGGGA